MKKKQTTKRLSLSKETLTVLDGGALQQAEGAAYHAGCQESVMICSIMHTCVSCRTTTIEQA